MRKIHTELVERDTVDTVIVTAQTLMDNSVVFNVRIFDGYADFVIPALSQESANIIAETLKKHSII